jgi:3-deoxy-D-manno-octulosonic-acid transferase
MEAAPARAIPADARRSAALYNACFPFVFLALLPSFLVRLFRRGNYRENFGQRLGLYSAADRERLSGSPPIWIHSISVGETLIALKLARELHRRDPATHIVLSATTSTGFALIRDAQADWLVPAYNPIDLRTIVRRALEHIRPRLLVLIEGEAWPNLLIECRRRGISVALANARLSPRSERRFQRFRAWTGPVFRLLDVICVPEKEDLERWESLGVPIGKIRCTGSMKFEQAEDGARRAEEFRTLLQSLGATSQTPILLAGSTHAGEEKILAQIYGRLRQALTDLLLIIVPRHIERAAEIIRELEPLGFEIIQRSTLPAPQKTATAGAILLVDTTGELRDWYAIATVVFVGKSLTATGGQNPAEPAALGKPVVFGPYMENFASIVHLLLTNDAASQVPTAEALEAELRTLLANPDLRAERGENARRVLTAHQGATSRTCDALQGLVTSGASS